MPLLLSMLITSWALAPNPSTDKYDSITKDAAFRKTISTGNFAGLNPGHVYYEHSKNGAGNLLVLVHGFSVPSYIWDSTFAKAKARGIPVLRLDLYGRGFSDNPEGPYNVELFANQVVGLLDHLGINDPVHLMGLSMGGAVISQIAAQHPERIQTLIYVDPSGFQPSQRPTKTQTQIVTPAEVEAFIRKDFPTRAAGQMDDFYKPELYDYWPALYEPLLTHRGFGRALLSTMKNARSMELENKAVGRATYPVHFLWGAQDRVCPLGDAKAQIGQWIPRHKLHVIDQCGHLPHIEQAQKFDAVLFKKILHRP